MTGVAGCVAMAAAMPCVSSVTMRTSLGRRHSIRGAASYSLRCGGSFDKHASNASSSAFWGQNVKLGHIRRQLPQGGKRVSRTLHPAVAQWNKEVTWSTAHIAEIGETAEQLYSVTLDVSKLPDIQKGYTKPGQFVQMKVGDNKPSFLAIASPVETAKSGSLEFLIKDVEGSSAALICDLAKGAAVDVSPVMGKGFNLDELTPPEKYSTVLLFATGSGISPIRAVLESGFDAIRRSDVRLYYGARNLERMAYQDRFKAWEASGVTVVRVLSQPSDSWTGEKGFVQDAFKRQDAVNKPESAGAILCGQKGMAEDVTNLLLGMGVDKSKILLNF